MKQPWALVLILIHMSTLSHGYNEESSEFGIREEDQPLYSNNQTEEEGRGIHKRKKIKRPHIIYILADDLGWYDVSWNNPKVSMPHLEKLAKKGMILEQSYVTPICGPSRAALMTGKYPHVIGRQHSVLRVNEPTGLDLKSTLLPEVLKQAGYDTHIIGKWHLGYCKKKFLPTSRGFKSFYGFYSGSSNYYSHKTRNILDLHHTEDNGVDNDLHEEDGIYSTYLYADRADAILDNRNHDDPLFLYYSFQSVHSPLQVPDEYIQEYKYIKHPKRQTFLGMVRAMDDGVGRLVKKLKQTGHYDNSIIIFSTDNGGPSLHKAGSCNWPLRGGKGTLYEGGTRGAAFIHSPVMNKIKRRSKQLLHITDWFPTLVSAAGAKRWLPKGLDGIDQWSALNDDAPPPRDSFIYHLDDTNNRMRGAIRMGNYKLMMGNIVMGNSGRKYKDNWVTPPEGLSSRKELSDFLELNSETYSNYKQDEVLTNKRFKHLKNKTAKDIMKSNIPVFLYNVKADPSERYDLRHKQVRRVRIMLGHLLREIKRVVTPDEPQRDDDDQLADSTGALRSGWCEKYN